MGESAGGTACRLLPPPTLPSRPDLQPGWGSGFWTPKPINRSSGKRHSDCLINVQTLGGVGTLPQGPHRGNGQAGQ